MNFMQSQCFIYFTLLFIIDWISPQSIFRGLIKGENILKSPKIIIPKLYFFAFQNFDKMSTPNLMAILWTLGRFEKFGSWLTRFFFLNQQKMKILHGMGIFGAN
jgi:hypothetical protein